MPTYKCQECGQEMTLSRQPRECEICGGVEFKFLDKKKAPTNTNKKASTSTEKSVEKFKDFSELSGISQPKTIPQSSLRPYSKKSKKSSANFNSSSYSSSFFSFIPRGLIGLIVAIILLLLGLGIYGISQLQFDTKDFKKVVLNEKFVKPKGWSLTKGASLKNGGLLQWQIPKNSYGVSIWKGRNFTDMNISASVLQLNKVNNVPYGIVARIGGKNYQNFYYLFITGDGKFVMGKRAPGKWFPKVGWQQSQLINKGSRQNNRLQLVCKEDLIIGFINGKQVGYFRDKSYKSGKIALATVRGKGNAVAVFFDNIIVKQKN